MGRRIGGLVQPDEADAAGERARLFLEVFKELAAGCDDHVLCGIAQGDVDQGGRFDVYL